MPQTRTRGQAITGVQIWWPYSLKGEWKNATGVNGFAGDTANLAVRHKTAEALFANLPKRGTKAAVPIRNLSGQEVIDYFPRSFFRDPVHGQRSKAKSPYVKFDTANCTTLQLATDMCVAHAVGDDSVDIEFYDNGYKKYSPEKFEWCFKHPTVELLQDAYAFKKIYRMHSTKKTKWNSEVASDLVVNYIEKWANSGFASNGTVQQVAALECGMYNKVRDPIKSAFAQWKRIPVVTVSSNLDCSSEVSEFIAEYKALVPVQGDTCGVDQAIKHYNAWNIADIKNYMQMDQYWKHLIVFLHQKIARYDTQIATTKDAIDEANNRYGIAQQQVQKVKDIGLRARTNDDLKANQASALAQKVLAPVIYKVAQNRVKAQLSVTQTLHGIGRYNLAQCNLAVDAATNLLTFIGQQELPILAKLVWSVATGLITERSMQDLLYDMNLVIVGEPGTGKSTAAGWWGKFLLYTGLLASMHAGGEVVALGQTDLQGDKVGETAPKTMNACLQSLEKVCFLDEAYDSVKKDAQGSYGGEVATTLVLFASQNRGLIGFVAAGYDKAMTNDFYPANIGLRRRFGTKVVTECKYKEYVITALTRAQSLLQKNNYSNAASYCDASKKIWNVAENASYLQDKDWKLGKLLNENCGGAIAEIVLALYANGAANNDSADPANGNIVFDAYGVPNGYKALGGPENAKRLRDSSGF